MGMLSLFLDRHFPFLGKVVHRSDVRFCNGSVLSLRLKRESNGRYHALLCNELSEGSYCVDMELDELDTLIEAIRETQKMARELLKPAT